MYIQAVLNLKTCLADSYKKSLKKYQKIKTENQTAYIRRRCCLPNWRKNLFRHAAWLAHKADAKAKRGRRGEVRRNRNQKRSEARPNAKLYMRDHGGGKKKKKGQICLEELINVLRVCKSVCVSVCACVCEGEPYQLLKQSRARRSSGNGNGSAHKRFYAVLGTK